MNNSLIEQYLAQGINAVKKYELSKIDAALDEITSKTEKIHFKGTAKTFKSKTLEFSGIILGGKKEMFQFLNKNKYYNNVLKFTEEYIDSHPEEVQKFAADVERETKMKLADIGFDNKFYNNFAEALKKQGLVGKPGALNVLADTIITNLDPIVDSFNTGIQTPRAMNRGLITRNRNKSLEFIADSGITTEGIKNAYATSEFKGEKGVIKYVTDKLIVASAPYADALLMQLKMSGIEHETTSQALVESYQKKGFFGKEGLVEKIVGVGMKVPGVEKFVYIGLLTAALDDKKKKVKAELRKHMPLGSSLSDIDKLVDKQFNDTVKTLASVEIPDVISGEKLQGVFNAKGLYGNEGLLGYINNNIPAIFTNAKTYGLVEESDINTVQKVLNQIVAAESFKDLMKSKKTSYEKYSIAIARKSEELGINPSELLSDNKYIAEKKSAIIEGYESLDNYLKRNKSLEDILPYIDHAINHIQTGDVTVEKVKSIVDGIRPRRGIFREGFDKITSKIVTKNIIDKTEDYLRLTKGFIEYKIAESKKDAELYH